MLQVLDDGHITDAQGRKVNFKNTILISAKALESSVFPTPVGPKNKKEPIGLFGSFNPTLPLRIAFKKKQLKKEEKKNKIIAKWEKEKSSVKLFVDENQIAEIVSNWTKIRTLEEASSIKSMALSGKNLSFKYLLDILTAATKASSEIFTP